MALRMNTEVIAGINVPNAYLRVENVNFIRDEAGDWFGIADIHVYTKDPSTGGQQVPAPKFDRRKVAVDLATLTADPRAWAYGHLKSLPEFTGAVNI